tara:strand:- start:942 stop:1526 length:585 start_codon:yes stop_codon:yes gene_type:complete
MNKYIFTLLIVSFSFAIKIPLNVDTNWEALETNTIVIQWQRYDGFPFCKATKILSSTMEELIQLLDDKENYYKIFERIEYSKLLTSEIVHIKLDMPFPFSGRDYIVKYTKSNIKNDFIYSFEATTEIAISIDDDYVRLVNASGGWILHPIDEHTTELTYMWNGELLGDFPNWALTRAWIEQGNEVMAWIEDALE